MNSKQRIVIAVAIALFSLSEFFPPWQYEDKGTSAEKSAGYHFIFSPDPKVEWSEIKRVYSITDTDSQGRQRSIYPEQYEIRRDLIRLHGQRAILLFLTLGLFLVFDGRKAYFKTALGVAAFIAALCFTALYIFYVEPYWR